MKLKDNVKIEVKENIYEGEINTITANGKRWRIWTVQSGVVEFNQVEKNGYNEWESDCNWIEFRPNNKFYSNGATDLSDLIELSKLVEEGE